MYACLAEGDGELSFEPNQIITNGNLFLFFSFFLIKTCFPLDISLLFVEINYYDKLLTVKASLEPGWLEGTLNGKTGLVPKNYVEQLP